MNDFLVDLLVVAPSHMLWWRYECGELGTNWDLVDLAYVAERVMGQRSGF